MKENPFAFTARVLTARKGLARRIRLDRPGSLLGSIPLIRSTPA